MSIIKVTCIGDSITAGSGDWQSGGISYCDKLRALLGDGYQIMNAGLSANTMFKDGRENDGSPRSYWSSQTWIDAQNSQADIYTIMLGTNDSKMINWDSP
jgi:lysophospholipase L1-like esterase